MQQLCQVVSFFTWSSDRAFDDNGDLIDERTVDFLIVVFYLPSLCICANQLNLPEEVRFERGLYHVTTEGHNGKLPMDVTVSEDRIEKSEIDSSGESSGIADVVFTRIPAEIIEGQPKR